MKELPQLYAPMLFTLNENEKIMESWRKNQFFLMLVKPFTYVYSNCFVIFDTNPDDGTGMLAPNFTRELPPPNGKKKFESEEQEERALWYAKTHIEYGFTPAKELFGKYKGQTAIICGSGPSLEKNSELLADRDLEKTKVIALNASLTQVADYADFYFLIDTDSKLHWYQEYYREYIKLICSPVANPGTRKYWTAKDTYIFDTHWTYDKAEISEAYKDCGMVQGVLLCTYSCLNMVYLMGFDRVILIGQDFSFPDESKRYITGAKKDKEPLAHKILTVKDIYGNDVQTYEYLIREKNAVKAGCKILEDNDIECYNCTEGGILDIDKINDLGDLI